jgi:DHA1 family tetracycline resistance protein-like MFS transporter
MTKSSPKLALLVVFAVVVVDLLGFGMVLPLLPVYAEQLTAGYSASAAPKLVGALMVSFSVMQLVCAPLWGRVSDRVGRRPVLLAGLVGSVLFYAMFGVATMLGSLPWMFVSRIGAGVAGATISTAQAYIADVTTREHRTRGMALIGAAFGLGFTIGPLVGALALWISGDRAGISPWPGYVAAALSGMALLLAVFKLPESLDPAASRASRRYVDLASLREALAVPSIGLLLLTAFLCVFAMANFEGTISFSIASLLEKSSAGEVGHGGVHPIVPKRLQGQQILLVFAYVGLIQSLVQGVLVRRLAAFASESLLASIGSVLAVAGYLLLAVAADPEHGRLGLLMAASAVEVAGISFIDPSLRSLISRRSSTAEQGGILGAGEAVSAVARITGVYFGVQLYYRAPSLPFLTAAGLMCLALALVTVAVRRGKDWV